MGPPSGSVGGANGVPAANVEDRLLHAEEHAAVCFFLFPPKFLLTKTKCSRIIHRVWFAGRQE